MKVDMSQARTHSGAGSDNPFVRSSKNKLKRKN